MSKITYQKGALWQNFHRTLGDRVSPEGPAMLIDSLAHIDVSDAMQPSGLERFATTGAALFAHLRTLERTVASSFAAGTVGQGWSFAPLIGTPNAQLDALGLKGIAMLADDERDRHCRVAADCIALTSGGTTLVDLATWAEQGHNRTIQTSGTFLHPTVAGSTGSGSHGSRLGFGGIQNMVLGMHLIVGSDEHVWIEPASAPVLSATGIARLAIDGKSPRVVRDDDMFEDVLVHLGAMGIVNGLALALVPDVRLTVLRRVSMLDADFLKDIAAGRFQAIAERLGCTAAPLFYELTINPHGLFDYVATNTMYFATRRVNFYDAGDANLPNPANTIMALGTAMLNAVKNARTDIPQALVAAPKRTIPQWVLPLLIGAPSAFDRYLGMRQYVMPNETFDPDDESAPGPFHWSELHKGEISGDTPGALYNASFAIPLEQVDKALPLICAAVAALEPSFVFTLRFVDKASGTLAFTRFERNAVIEIDGLSPLICMQSKAVVNPALPYAADLTASLDVLAGTLPEGARLVRQALDGNGIPYSMHWAKLGGLDKAKVHADYGHPRDPDSLIYQWQQTRGNILTSFGKSIFWNRAVMDYGILP